MLKLFLENNSSGTIKPIAGKIRGSYLSPMSISSKVNVTAWLESTLAYYNAKLQHFQQYATGTSPSEFETYSIKERKIIENVNKIYFIVVSL